MYAATANGNGTANHATPATQAAVDAARTEADLLEQQIRLERLQARKGRAETARWEPIILNQRARRALTESGGESWEWIGGAGDWTFDGRRPEFGRPSAFVSTARDRRYGAFWPFWRSWTEHARIRQASRICVTQNQLAKGALAGITSFVIGKGFTYRITPKKRVKEVPPELIDAVQHVIDDFDERNNWPMLERDLFTSSRKDGEALLRHFVRDGGYLDVRPCDPSWLIEPPDLNPDVNSYGIINDPEDLMAVTGYWVAMDGFTGNGEEVPASEMTHIKCNLEGEPLVKRGLPDFSFDTFDTFKRIKSLLENMETGGAIQSSIALIRQHANASRSEVTDFAAGEAHFKNVMNPRTGTYEKERLYQPGEIIDMDAGQEYVAPPFASNVAGFVALVQAALRSVAVRWNAPEWLVSADASNNNFASSIVAESPFVKRCHIEQQQYGQHFVRTKWKAIKAACDAGRVRTGTRRWSYEEVRALCDIQVTPPVVETRDRMQEASRNQIEIMAGYKSRQMSAEEQGYDWERVSKDNQQFADASGMDGTPLGLDAEGNPIDTPDDAAGFPVAGGAAGGRATSGMGRGAGGGQQSPIAELMGTAGLKQIADLQSQVYAGALPREAAIASLVTLIGLPQEVAVALFPEAKPVKTADDGSGGDGGGDDADGLGAMLDGPTPDEGGGDAGDDAPLESLLSESAENHRTQLPLFEAGFSGERKDSAGRRRCYRDGKLVPCPKEGQKADSKASKPASDGKGKGKAATGAKAAKPTVAEAHDHIKGLLDTPGKLNAKAAVDLAGRLSQMTVKDLTELKKNLGLKASGTKSELAKKVAERALAKATASSKAKPKAAATPAARKTAAKPVTPATPTRTTADSPTVKQVVAALPDHGSGQPETFGAMYDKLKAADPGMTEGQFHDIIRELYDRGEVALQPYTRAFTELGNDSRAFFYRGEVMRYATKGKK